MIYSKAGESSTLELREEKKSRDARFMRQIATHTAKTQQTPYPTPFGAMIVSSFDGEILVKQVNHCAQNTDPTAHAEVHAIRAACRKVKSLSLRGYTLYTTCEPCPMCMAASLWASLDRVVYGATIDDASAHCNQIYTYSKHMVKKSDLTCEVVGPVEREICCELFEQSPVRNTGSTRKSIH
jgi:tRNA(Arg) A34 adenosine deaminase TadA